MKSLHRVLSELCMMSLGAALVLCLLDLFQLVNHAASSGSKAIGLKMILWSIGLGILARMARTSMPSSPALDAEQRQVYRKHIDFLFRNIQLAVLGRIPSSHEEEGNIANWTDGNVRYWCFSAAYDLEDAERLARVMKNMRRANSLLRRLYSKRRSCSQRSTMLESVEEIITQVEANLRVLGIQNRQ